MSGYGLGPGFFLVCIDFPRILKYGAKSVIEEAKECLKNLRYFSSDAIEKQHYWEAVIRVFKAWVRFAGRYADLAEKMAGEETDEKRKGELLEMARICRKVPYEPAETFREAMQAFWFTFLLALPSPTATAGRFDQYMYPFYRHDIDAGLITDDEVLELLEIMRCKIMKINRVSGKANRAKNSGMAKWYNWTIGGVNEKGEDVTNELSYLLLESALDTQLPHFTITVRVHEKTPMKLMQKAMEVVRSGLGMPAFLGDPSYIRFFTMNGMPLEEARDYCATGCVDGNVPAKARSQVVTFFIIAQAFDIFMHNGYCRYTKENVGMKTGDVTEFQTFEEFKAAFYRQMDYLMHMAAERNNVELIAERNLFPDPFRSALMEGGVASGRDMLDRHFAFENGSLLGAVGGVNTGDSLAAVKTLVFDQKKYTMAELLAALAVLHSAMKVDQDPYQGTLMNMKFHPSAMRTEEDLMKLASVVKAYLTHGGKHIQFNVVSREDLVDAKIHPEAHPELVVRVAGYSAYFTRLSTGIQDEVINRTAHDL